MSDIIDIIRGSYEAYKHSASYKDSVRMEVAVRKQEFEEHLDEMWSIYSHNNPRQIVEYNKQLDYIKGCGCKVLRNSKGKHKIVIGG